MFRNNKIETRFYGKYQRLGYSFSYHTFIQKGCREKITLILRLICLGINPFMIVAPCGLAHFATTQSCLEECVDEMKIKT